jgi:hypothetical protein
MAMARYKYIQQPIARLLMDMSPAPRQKNTWKDLINLGPVAGYFFRKHDPNAKPNFNLRMMHGVNKISMIMFLVSVIILIIKLSFRS